MVYPALEKKGQKLKNVIQGQRGFFRNEVDLLRLFFATIDDNFKGAGDGFIRANKLTHGTPAAVFDLNNLYSVIFHYQGAADTDADTESAPLAFFLVDYRCVTHFHSSPQSYC